MKVTGVYFMATEIGLVHLGKSYESINHMKSTPAERHTIPNRGSLGRLKTRLPLREKNPQNKQSYSADVSDFLEFTN